jgi:hypothetical protein
MLHLIEAMCSSKSGGNLTSISMERPFMKKRSMLKIIVGAAVLSAAPFSLHWSHEKNVALSLDRADARIGRPGTALSVAGVHRRAYRRAYRGAVYGGAAAAAAYGVGSYYGAYSYPGYSSGSYGYPGYSYGYPAYGYAPGYRAARRVAIHRARWH